MRFLLLEDRKFSQFNCFTNTFLVPIHCEFPVFMSSCSKGPFFRFQNISPYPFFNALASFQLTITLSLLILPFTDLRKFTYRKKFSFLEVEVSQKLAKKRRKERILFIANFCIFCMFLTGRAIEIPDFESCGSGSILSKGVDFFP